MTNFEGRGSQRHPDDHEIVRTIEASAALQLLLAAASAPPTAAELAGHSRAVAGFRRSPSARPESRRPSRHRVIWSPTARFGLVGAALVLILGGTGVAAAAGGLPVALQSTVRDLFHASAPAPHRSADRSVGTASDGAGPSSSAAAGRRWSSAVRESVAASTPGLGLSSAPTATSQLAGLCRAIRAGANPALTLSTPAFRPLARAAGGAAKVTTYCAGLIGRVEATRPTSVARIRSPSAATSGAWPRGTAQQRRHPSISSGRLTAGTADRRTR